MRDNDDAWLTFAIAFALAAWLCFLIVFFVGAARASEASACFNERDFGGQRRCHVAISTTSSSQIINIVRAEPVSFLVGPQTDFRGQIEDNVEPAPDRNPYRDNRFSDHVSIIVLLTYADVHAIVCQPSYTWNCETMMAIAYRESRFDNTAVNPESGCACWFQIHPMHGYGQALLTRDPLACTLAAYRLWQADGYRPWEATR